MIWCQASIGHCSCAHSHTALDTGRVPVWRASAQTLAQPGDPASRVGPRLGTGQQEKEGSVGRAVGGLPPTLPCGLWRPGTVCFPACVKNLACARGLDTGHTGRKQADEISVPGEGWTIKRMLVALAGWLGQSVGTPSEGLHAKGLQVRPPATSRCFSLLRTCVCLPSPLSAPPPL